MQRITIILLSQVFLCIFATVLSLWETIAMFAMAIPTIGTTIESLFYAGVAFGFDGRMQSLRRHFVWPTGKPVLKSILNWVFLSVALTIGSLLILKLTIGFTDRAPTINVENGILFFFIPLLVLCGLGPFAEEWLFRGYLQADLIPRWGARKAIAVSAFFFALLHSLFFQEIIFLIYWHISGVGNDIGGVGTLFGPTLGGIFMKTGYALIYHLPGGLLYGYLAYREKSLWPAVVAHATHNLLIINAWNYENLEYFLGSVFGMNSPGLLPYIVLAICFYIFFRGVVKKRFA